MKNVQKNVKNVQALSLWTSKLFDRETRSIAVLEVYKLLGQTLIKKLQKVFLIVIIRSATGKQFLLQSF